MGSRSSRWGAEARASEQKLALYYIVYCILLPAPWEALAGEGPAPAQALGGAPRGAQLNTTEEPSSVVFD